MTTAEDRLDAHQAARDGGRPRVSLILGFPNAAQETLARWAKDRGRMVVWLDGAMLDGAARRIAMHSHGAWIDLAQTLDGGSQNDPKPWRSREWSRRSEERAAVSFSMRMIKSDPTCIRALLDFARAAPWVPLIAATSFEIDAILLRRVNEGDRAAAFLRDGVIFLGQDDESVIRHERYDKRRRRAASAAKRRSGVADHDSRAEAYLGRLIEDDPVTQGLFTPQGEPGFLMANNQPARCDFLCAALKLAVEIDGPHHLEAKQYRTDRRKDRTLQKLDYHVLRFLAEEVTDDFEAVLRQIRDAVLWRAQDRASGVLGARADRGFDV